MSTQERRQHPRVAVNRSATVRAANGQTQRVQLVDLSIAGLGLLLPQAVNIGDSLGISFHLSHGNQSLFITVQGVIRRSHIRGNDIVVGVEIQHIETDAQKLIAAFVRHKLELGGHMPSGQATDPVSTA
jgi:c-di-GMP-binding flagellar brake protein YcgR